MTDKPHAPPPWSDVFYPDASVEPLEIIRINECDEGLGGLATKRFQALWNEIQRLRAALPSCAEADREWKPDVKQCPYNGWPYQEREAWKAGYYNAMVDYQSWFTSTQKEKA